LSLWWVFAFYFLERSAEVLIARRNQRITSEKGGKEYFPETYRTMVGFHLAFLAALFLESAPWHVPLDPLTFFCLISLALLQFLRYWCIAVLGEFWNTRIIVVPGAQVRRRGPYRFMRHPNYLVVTLELALLPLLMRAPITLLVFSLGNLALLRRRIFLEEKALRDHTDYNCKFPSKEPFGSD